MASYVKSTDFAAKDALVSGNPAKLIKGTEINDEFNNIQTAIATKADLASPTFSGNPTCATQAIGNNSTRLANTAFVQQEIADAEAAINITGGNISAVNITDVIITDADISGLVAPLAVADGGTGNATLTANSVLLGNGTSAIQQVSPTTAGNVLRTNGTTWQSQNNLLRTSAQNATSGTTIDFTSIPDWVKRITVMFSGVSTSGNSPILLQLGDSGGIETTGYLGSYTLSNSGGAAAGLTSTAGFTLDAGTISSSSTRYGSIVLSLIDTNNNWICSSNLGHSNSAITISTFGGKTVSTTLDRLRITTVNGTDTFDAGTINIIYE